MLPPVVDRAAEPADQQRHGEGDARKPLQADENPGGADCRRGGGVDAHASSSTGRRRGLGHDRSPPIGPDSLTLRYMRAVLVVNPKATATTAAGRDVLAHALASEVKLDVVETDYRGHAMAAAAQAAVDGADLVVAHGGDGTVNEVVNGLLRRASAGIAADARHRAGRFGQRVRAVARPAARPGRGDAPAAARAARTAAPAGRARPRGSTAGTPRGGSRSAPASVGRRRRRRGGSQAGQEGRAPRCTRGSR